MQKVGHARKMADLEYLPCCCLEIHKSVENVADSPTLVFHIGRESHSEYCAVMVTGNPGMIEFYEVFMLQLHKASRCHLEVVGISQAGKLWKQGKVFRSFSCISGGFKGVQEGANSPLGNSAAWRPQTARVWQVHTQDFFRYATISKNYVWLVSSDRPSVEMKIIRPRLHYTVFK